MLFDHHNRRTAVAPSHGLVAIGVRMSQQFSKSEGPLPPDSFTYTAFQLNPANLYAKARSRLMGRIRIPSHQDLHRMMVEEGYADEAGPPPASFCSCGRLGPHRH